MNRYAWLTLSMLACNGGGGPDDTDDGDGNGNGTGDGDPFAQFVNVEDEQEGGDFTGFTPGADYASTTWVERSIDADNVGDVNLSILVEDFESDEPVEDATGEVWLGDEATGVPDLSGTSDQNGLVSLTLPTCQPFSYRVSTNPALDETKVSIAAHKIVPYNGGAPPADQQSFVSVSKTTYQLIPSILGISPSPEKAIVAGTVYDTLGEGKVENAQIIVYNGSGDIVTDAQVKYFVEEFPNRDQPTTSEDGLWVAINVPPGSLRVEAWGVVNGTLGLLGATLIESYADSINLGNIYGGNGTGVFVPDECLAEDDDGDTDDTDDTDG